MVLTQKMKRFLKKHGANIIIALLVPSLIGLYEFHLTTMDRARNHSFISAFIRYTQNAGSALIEKGGFVGLLFPPLEPSIEIKVSTSVNVIHIKNTNNSTNSTIIPRDIHLHR